MKKQARNISDVTQAMLPRMIRSNQDEIGENELLVVSFGTSFNDSRAQDIKGIEDALAGSLSGLVRKTCISQHRSSSTM